MTEYPKVIYEKIKHPFIFFCLKHKITANQITVINHAITLTFGGYLFLRGSYLFYIGALAVCLLNGFMDYLDGDISRERKGNNELGEWLDSGFDCIIQNAILGAIAIGCYKQGLPLLWIVLFFIGNASSNYVSFFYNEKFGFKSSNGNSLFRTSMDHGYGIHNVLLKNMIDPTSSYIALLIYTYRYFIAVGCVLNIMPLCFMAFTVICNIRWFIMYIIYALYLHAGYNFHILKSLSILDEESDDFYKLRSGRPV